MIKLMILTIIASLSTTVAMYCDIFDLIEEKKVPKFSFFIPFKQERTLLNINNEIKSHFQLQGFQHIHNSDVVVDEEKGFLTLFFKSPNNFIAVYAKKEGTDDKVDFSWLQIREFITLVSKKYCSCCFKKPEEIDILFNIFHENIYEKYIQRMYILPTDKGLSVFNIN
jgi:hypothetical protein